MLRTQKPRVNAPHRGPGVVAWTDPAFAALAALTALAILCFYAARLFMPLPIFGADEASYLARALFDPATLARNPLVAEVTNGALLSVIRASAALRGDDILTNRLVNSAAYLAGLLLLLRVVTARLPLRTQLAFLILTVGFPYYRFAFSNMAEGLFVGVLCVMCAATATLYRQRPALHALAFGTLGAVLVLVKPHGIAVIAAFVLVVALDAALSRDPRTIVVRLPPFAGAFFVIGNLIQSASGQPVASAWLFFVSPFYGATLGATYPPNAAPLAILNLLAMSSAAAVLAGVPVVIALSDIVRRWRAERGGFRLQNLDVLALVLLAALAATLVMVTIFALKVASTPSEGMRLWGRYFEFFAPLLWLSAAPAIVRLEAVRSRATRLACAGVLALGLAGLLVSFRAGVVLFPWDFTATTAFFAPDPTRANIVLALPYRAISVAVTLIAVAAIAWRTPPLRVGVFLILALGVLSTLLDHAWLGPMVTIRTQLDRDIRAVTQSLPVQPGATIILAADPNEGTLSFLKLGGRPRVLLTTPQTTPPDKLRSAQAVIVAGSDASPGDPWVRTYKGQRLSVFQRAGPASR